MDSQAFELLMTRFDTIEEQNKQQLDLLAKHVTEDEKVHKVVERHSVYFRALSVIGVPTGLAFLLAKLGLK